MIHSYIGDGKGKTTAAIGLAARFAGSGKKVLFMQFLKGNESSELTFLKNTNIVVKPCQTCVAGFYWEMNEEEKKKLKKETNNGFIYAIKCAENNEFDMIVLDEIAGAIENLLLPEDALVDFLMIYGKEKEIVITGRKISEKILELSDYVSIINKLKHPYDKGIEARCGIEY